MFEVSLTKKLSTCTQGFIVDLCAIHTNLWERTKQSKDWGGTAMKMKWSRLRKVTPPSRPLLRILPVTGGHSVSTNRSVRELFRRLRRLTDSERREVRFCISPIGATARSSRSLLPTRTSCRYGRSSVGRL
jgi:hypothetical protein